MAETSRGGKPGSCVTPTPPPPGGGKPGNAVEVLAAAKKLPPDWLTGELGLADGGCGRVLIPYFGRDGSLLYQRTRNPEGVKPRFISPAGVVTKPYGLWKLAEAKRAKLLFISEGESDTWTLWSHGLPALGLPGHSTAGAIDIQDLDGIEFVHVTVDRVQGDVFARAVADRLRRIGYPGKAFAVRMPEGVDDVSDLHIRDPQRFHAAITAAAEKAERITADSSSSKAKAAAPSTPASVPKLVTTKLSTVRAEPVRCLVPGLIPLGYITIFAGETGHGKSTLTMHLAAAVSRGLPAFDRQYDPGPPADVLLVSCEDGLAEMITPRLLSCGADLERIEHVEGVRGQDGKLMIFDLNRHESMAALLAERPGTRLLVIDPVTAFVGRTGTDDHRDSELRSLLAPWATLAREHQVAIVLVMHLNKNPTPKAVHRILGSGAYVNASRAAYVIAKDRDEPARRLLAPVKANVFPDAKGFAFGLEALPSDEAEALLAEHAGHLDEEGRDLLRKQLYKPAWYGELDITADEALAPSKKGRGPSRPEQCAAWIKDQLGFHPRLVAQIDAEAEQAGFSRDAIKEAKTLLRAQGVHLKKREMAGPWWIGVGDPTSWVFPTTPSSPSSPSS